VRTIANWFFIKFGEWVSDRISGVLWWWVGGTCVEAFNAIGWYDATFALMKIQAMSEVLDLAWYIYTIFFGISLLLWFLRKTFPQLF